MYSLAAALLFVSAIDVLIAVWPIEASQAAWRFEALGLLSRSLLGPMLGLLIVFGAALYLKNRGILKMLAAVSALLAVTLAGSTALFGLDGLEMRLLVNADARGRFDVTAVTSMAKMAITFVVAAAFSLLALRAARSIGAARPTAGSKAGPGIVAASRESRP